MALLQTVWVNPPNAGDCTPRQGSRPAGCAKTSGRHGPVPPEAEASRYPNEALTGCAVQPASSRLGVGSPGLQSRGGRVLSAAVTVVPHPRTEFMHTLEPRSLLSHKDVLVLRIQNTPTHFGDDPKRNPGAKQKSGRAGATACSLPMWDRPRIAARLRVGYAGLMITPWCRRPRARRSTRRPCCSCRRAEG